MNVYVYVCVCVCMCVCMYVYVHSPTHTHTLTHSLTHTNTHNRGVTAVYSLVMVHLNVFLSEYLPGHVRDPGNNKQHKHNPL